MNDRRENSTPSRRLVLLWSALLWGWVAQVGAEVSVEDFDLFRRGEELILSMGATDLLDDKTRMTVESGMPGTCVYAIRLENNANQVLSERFVERTLRLDLWENVFVLEEASRVRTFPTLAAADSAWSRIDSLSLGSMQSVMTAGAFRVLVAIAVEPLAPKDRERLSRYVGRNSSGQDRGQREELTLDVGAVLSRFLGLSQREEVWEYVSPRYEASELEERP